MSEIQCPDHPDKDFDDLNSLRMHVISSGDHDYPEDFEDLKEEFDDSSESSDSGSEESEDQDSSGSESSGEDFEEKEGSLQDLIQQKSGQHEDEEDSEESEKSSEESSGDLIADRSGTASTVNDVAAQMWVLDLDPDSEKHQNIKRNIQDICETAKLGENFERVLDKYMDRDEELPPEHALVISALLVIGMGLPQRPDIAKEAWSKLKGDENSEDEADDGGED